MNTKSTSKGKTKQRYPNLLLNDPYQGSYDSGQKSTGKTGMQYLGRINGSNRLPPPVWLPSKKAELSGQNPNINIVPAGTSGWGANKSTTNPKSSSIEEDEKDLDKHQATSEEIPKQVENNHIEPISAIPKNKPLKPFFQTKEPELPPEEPKEVPNKSDEIIESAQGASEIVGKITGWAAVNEEPNFNEQIVFSGDEDNSFDKQFSSCDEADEEEVETDDDVMMKPVECVEPIINHQINNNPMADAESLKKMNDYMNPNIFQRDNNSLINGGEQHQMKNMSGYHGHQNSQAYRIMSDNQVIQPNMFDNAPFDHPSLLQDYGIIKQRDERTQDFNNAIEKAHKNRRKPNMDNTNSYMHQHQQFQQPPPSQMNYDRMSYNSAQNSNRQQHQNSSYSNYENSYVKNHHGFNQQPQQQQQKCDNLNDSYRGNIWAGPKQQHNGNNDKNTIVNNNTPQISILNKHDNPFEHQMPKEIKILTKPKTNEQKPNQPAQQVPKVDQNSNHSNDPNSSTSLRQQQHQQQQDQNLDDGSIQSEKNNQTSTKSDMMPIIKPLMEINAQPTSDHLNHLWEDGLTKANNNTTNNRYPNSATNQIRSGRGASSRGGYSSYKRNMTHDSALTIGPESRNNNYSSNRSQNRNQDNVPYNKSNPTQKKNWNSNVGENNRPSSSDHEGGSRKDINPGKYSQKDYESNKKVSSNRWNANEEQRKSEEPSDQVQSGSMRMSKSNRITYSRNQKVTKSDVANPNSTTTYSRGGLSRGRGGTRGGHNRQASQKNHVYNSSDQNGHDYYRKGTYKDHKNPDDKSDSGAGNGLGSNSGLTNNNNNTKTYSSQHQGKSQGNNNHQQQQQGNSNGNQKSKQNHHHHSSRECNSDVDEWETATEGSVSETKGQHTHHPVDTNNTNSANYNQDDVENGNKAHRKQKDYHYNTTSNDQSRQNPRFSNNSSETYTKTSSRGKFTSNKFLSKNKDFRPGRNQWYNNSNDEHPSKAIQKSDYPSQASANPNYKKGYKNNNRNSTQGDNQTFSKRDNHKSWRHSDKDDRTNPEHEKDSKDSNPEESEEKKEVSLDNELPDIIDYYDSKDFETEEESDVGFVEVVPKSSRRKQKKQSELTKRPKNSANDNNKKKNLSTTTKPSSSSLTKKNLTSTEKPATKKFELNVSKEVIKKQSIEIIPARRPTTQIKPTTDAWQKPSLTVKAICGDKKAKQVVHQKPNESANSQMDNVSTTGGNNGSKKEKKTASWSKAVGSRVLSTHQHENESTNHKRFNQSSANAMEKTKFNNDHQTTTSTDLQSDKGTMDTRNKSTAKTTSETSDAKNGSDSNHLNSIWKQPSAVATQQKMQLSQQNLINSHRVMKCDDNTVAPNESSDEDSVTKSSDSSKLLPKTTGKNTSSLSAVTTSNNVCKVKPQQHSSSAQQQAISPLIETTQLTSSASVNNKIKLISGTRNITTTPLDTEHHKKSSMLWNNNTTDSQYNQNLIHSDNGPSTTSSTTLNEMIRPEMLTKQQQQQLYQVYQESKYQPSTTDMTTSSLMDMYPQSPVNSSHLSSHRQLFQQANYPSNDLFGYNESHIFQNDPNNVIPNVRGGSNSSSAVGGVYTTNSPNSTATTTGHPQHVSGMTNTLGRTPTTPNTIQHSYEPHNNTALTKWLQNNPNHNNNPHHAGNNNYQQSPSIYQQQHRLDHPMTASTMYNTPGLADKLHANGSGHHHQFNGRSKNSNHGPANSSLISSLSNSGNNLSILSSISHQIYSSQQQHQQKPGSITSPGAATTPSHHHQQSSYLPTGGRSHHYRGSTNPPPPSTPLINHPPPPCNVNQPPPPIHGQLSLAAMQHHHVANASANPPNPYLSHHRSNTPINDHHHPMSLSRHASTRTSGYHPHHQQNPNLFHEPPPHHHHAHLQQMHQQHQQGHPYHQHPHHQSMTASGFNQQHSSVTNDANSLSQWKYARATIQ